MKKSAAVPATFCAAVAALIIEGCGPSASVRRCVDPSTNRVLPDTVCEAPAVASVIPGRYKWVTRGAARMCMDTTTNIQVSDINCQNTMGRSNAFVRRGSWIYDGSVRNGVVSGFTSTPRAGADVQSSAGRVITRGGFGSTGSSSSGFSS